MCRLSMATKNNGGRCGEWGAHGKVSFEWAASQAYIALGNFMTACSMIGVDTCPIEGIDPAKYDEILGLVGSDWITVVACPAGYRCQKLIHRI